VHGVAAPQTPLVFRAQPVAIHRRRGRHPQVVISADDHGLFAWQGKHSGAIAIGAHSQEARRAFEPDPEPPTGDQRCGSWQEAQAILPPCGADRNRRRGAGRIRSPAPGSRRPGDRSRDRRPRGHFVRGVTDRAGIGRLGFAPRFLRLADPRQAAGRRGRCGKPHRSRPSRPRLDRSCAVPSTAACPAWQPVHRAAGPAAERTRTSCGIPRPGAAHGRLHRPGSSDRIVQPPQPTVYLPPLPPQGRAVQTLGNKAPLRDPRAMQAAAKSARSAAADPPPPPAGQLATATIVHAVAGSAGRPLVSTKSFRVPATTAAEAWHRGTGSPAACVNSRAESGRPANPMTS